MSKSGNSTPISNSEHEQQSAYQEEEKLAQEETKNAFDSISNNDAYYNHYALNFVIGATIGENRQAKLIPLGEEQNLEENLLEFRDNAELTRLVIPIRPVDQSGNSEREHFTGIFIEKNGGQYHAFYIDPTGEAAVEDIPEQIMEKISAFGIAKEQIIVTKNKIQHKQKSSEELEYITNVHCGAFTGFILSGLAMGNIRIENERLQINTSEGWQDIADLDEEKSNGFGIEIRQGHLQLFGVKEQEEEEQDLQEITARLDEVTLDEFYPLRRSDSGMSQYSDLIDEMLADQMRDVDSDFEESAEEYEVIDVLDPNEDFVKAEKQIKQLESENKSLGQQARKATEEEKKKHKQKQEENKSKKEKLKKKIDSLSKGTEVDYDENLADRKMHLFRGKNLNSLMIDPATGEERLRTKEERERYATRNYKGRHLYSDGTSLIAGEEDKEKAAQEKVRKYIKSIKAGSGKKSLFGAGTAYNAAVRYLMQITDLKGNPVVATSKFPWVAAEYMVGQMGGNAGNGRSVEFGYQQDGKPVNRLMGNGFVMSIALADYKRLRDDDDLIDVNLDIKGRGIEPNRVIEEVTFVSKVDGQYVMGSLPMVLPRLDRKWDDMSEEKRAQYERVFGIDEAKYKEFQGYLESKEEYPLGIVTEHLIRHHGNLLREMAIKIDRTSGYNEKFVATRDHGKTGSYHGDLSDLNADGKKLQARTARSDSSKKKVGYLSRTTETDKKPPFARSLGDEFDKAAKSSEDDLGGLERKMEEMEIQTTNKAKKPTAKKLDEKDKQNDKLGK